MAFNIPPPPSSEDVGSHVWKVWFSRLQQAFTSIFIGVSQGGTGLSTLGTPNQILGVNNAGTALEYKTLNLPKRILSISGVSGSYTCRWDLYDEIRLTVSGNVSLLFSGATNGQGCVLTLKNTQAVSLPANVRFNTVIQAYSGPALLGTLDKLGFSFDQDDSKYDLVSIIRNIT